MTHSNSFKPKHAYPHSSRDSGRNRHTEDGEATAVDLKNAYVRKGQWRECKRRALRVDVRGSSCPVYISYPELSAHRFPVFTLAELGARFITQGTKVHSLKGYEITACLHFGPIQTEVRTKMVFEDGQSAALEFIDPPEVLRELVRDMFEIELTAASLVPFHNFSSPMPGPTHTTLYSDGEMHNLELFMKNDKLEGIAGSLSVLDLRFSWARGKPTALKITSMSDDRTQGPHFRKRLISFIRNLPDLNPMVRAELERVVAAA